MAHVGCTAVLPPLLLLLLLLLCHGPERAVLYRQDAAEGPETRLRHVTSRRRAQLRQHRKTKISPRYSHWKTFSSNNFFTSGSGMGISWKDVFMLLKINK